MLPRALADGGSSVACRQEQGWLLCRAAFLSAGYWCPPKSGSREIFLVRSLPPIFGVLRRVRDILPGLKGSEAKGKVKKGSAFAGRGLS